MFCIMSFVQIDVPINKHHNSSEDKLRSLSYFLENSDFINKYQLKKILNELQEIEFIEATGKNSGVKYIIHKSKLETTVDKITYTWQKKQEKARQIEAF